jgi:hypothetical protein
MTGLKTMACWNESADGGQTSYNEVADIGPGDRRLRKELEESPNSIEQCAG